MKTHRLYAVLSIAVATISYSESFGAQPSADWPACMPPSSRAAFSAINNQQSRSSSDYVSIIIQIDDDSIVDELTSKGVAIYFQRDDLLLASIPYSDFYNIIGLDGIRNVQANLSASVTMDVARPFTFVDAAQAGSSLPQEYTGAGVVTGISDIGFDAQHIAFQDAISAIYNYRTSYAEVDSATTKSEIAEWTTDSSSNYHGTHTTNIMAGRYTDGDYYGVATGSDLVVTTSTLTDVGILAGVESIIKYAKEAGEPAVINLSVGSYTGPHDGTDLVCQYLSKCADDAIICLAAGNYGAKNISASYTFSETDSIARVEIMDNPSINGFSIYGITDVWSNDSRPLSARFEIYNNDEGTLEYATDWCIGSEDDTAQLTLNSSTNSDLAKYLKGSIEVYSGVGALNDRFNVSFYYDYVTYDESSQGAWSLYRIGLAVTGEDGAEIEYFSDGSYSIMYKTPYLPTVTPGSDNSISNLCTADGIISVGSCNSRNSIPVLNSSDKTYSFDTNIVSSFTSYNGTLPHFCAPGNYVVSALSSEYYKSNPTTSVCAETQVDGTSYYWMGECGTSMATPIAAGIIALWLEADPSLTASDVLEIAKATCIIDFDDIDDPRWGYGCIDAQAGLEYIISNSGISSATIKPLVTVNSDGSLQVTAPSGAAVNLYDSYGRSLNPSATHRPGVYILSVEGCQPTKILIK